MLELDAVDGDALERRLVFEQLPFPLVHCGSSGLAQAAQGAVEFLEMLGRQHFGSLQNLARALVAAAHFLLLLIGQGQDAKGQNFVDLGAVEKIAGAFRRDLRDSRRG